MPEASGSREMVRSVAKTLDVIRAFDAEHRDLTLSDVARRTGQTRASARRFLLSLEALGFVRSDGQLFSLTPRVLSLGHAFLSLRLPVVAEPHLKALTADLGESTSASVFDGDDIVYVARVQTRRIMAVEIRVGTRFPAYATSMGRVLLAFASADALEAYFERASLEPVTPHTLFDPAALRDELGRTRERGWAVVDQELEIGLRSVAAPVFNPRGEAIAAINVSTTSASSDRFADEELARRLLATAGAIGDDLRLTRSEMADEPQRSGAPKP
ncbi:IclR family transcriptional regulator C-terminal domain-containing protein [Terrabacter sp. Soil810]|uniref:IclR family transcriptional regulator domain-containing protein n=1 Tax=Terrabacter sp. Soil810 TaxID=1736418 RepID=UPI00070B01CE|nr:IclR family transcriptional regulator C-terminal domain-containing protein [Terrabacter sp. Soil810]KRF47080.1 IclR family transcriptional regulator [Terrabacter sp. Soil810]